MSDDPTLSDFADAGAAAGDDGDAVEGSNADAVEGSDAGAGRESESDAGAAEAAESVETAASTAPADRESPLHPSGGAVVTVDSSASACDSCGADAARLWASPDGRRVCSGCKDWRQPGG